MQIKLAKHGGFCFGVQKAVDAVEKALDEAVSPLYTLGEVIHNNVVVQSLKQRGAQVIQSLDEVQEGSTVVIRAHGASQKVFEQAEKKGINLIDATCPFVRRVQNYAQRYARQGYIVYIVGKKDHPEVIGIVGWSEGKAVVLENIQEAKAIKNRQKACLLAQTTTLKELFTNIAEILQKKIGDLIVYDTICDTTNTRQQEAKELAELSDSVIVIGGKHSSNTQKLYEICKKYCDKTDIIENTDQSILEKYRSSDIISIIAGASTPIWMMMEVFTRMSELEKTTVNVFEQDTTGQAAENREEVAAVETAAEANTDSTAETDFMEAFEKTLVQIHSGQILTGSVVQVSENEVSVNIGYKSDGFIPRSEFSSDPDVNIAEEVKVGDEIEVEILKVNDSEGNVLLSRKNVLARKAWDAFIVKAEEEGAIFEAMGREVVKGGIIAYIDGVRTFIPASQVSNRYVENLHDFIGQPLRLKILELDKNKRRVVASQKAVLVEEAAELKKKVWETLVVGERRMGVVRRLTDFGAFVDIGGIDGLVHVTELAWGRVKHPKDILKEGQEIEVVIKAIDSERERISLGYKELLPDPWNDAGEKYPVGSIVEGTVVRIKPFGAFVSLEPRIDGLIHISQVDTKRIEKVEDILNIGEKVRCKVLSVDQDAKRISLSRREVILEEQTLEDMAEAEMPVSEASTTSDIEHATSTLGDIFPDIDTQIE